DGLELFGLGYSFGGFESLVMPADPRTIRTATAWTGGPLIRFHIGFEAGGGLKAAPDARFGRLAKAEAAKWPRMSWRAWRSTRTGSCPGSRKTRRMATC